MEKEVIKEKVINIISTKFKKPASEINEDQSFIEDLGADSLDIVDLILEMEKEFDIKIKDEDAEKIQKVGDAINFIYDNVS